MAVDRGLWANGAENAGIVGMVTERDVLRKTSPRTILTQKTLVRDIMSSHIMCVPPSTTVIECVAPVAAVVCHACSRAADTEERCVWYLCISV